MKKLIVTVVVIVVVAYLFIRYDESDNEVVGAIKASHPKLFSRRILISRNTKDALKCEYGINPGVRLGYHMEVGDLIEERMGQLQDFQEDAVRIKATADLNRWTYYRAFYQEAVNGLMQDGTIYRLEDDACKVEEEETITVSGEEGESEQTNIIED